MLIRQFSIHTHSASSIIFATTQCANAKSLRIRSYSGPYFPVFGLNTNYCQVESLKPRARRTLPPKLVLWNSCSSSDIQRLIKVYRNQLLTVTGSRAFQIIVSSLGVSSAMSNNHIKTFVTLEISCKMAYRGEISVSTMSIWILSYNF